MVCKRDDTRGLNRVGDPVHADSSTGWLEGNVFGTRRVRGIRINLTEPGSRAPGAKRIADRGGFAKTLKQRGRKSLDSTIGETAKPSERLRQTESTSSGSRRTPG